MKNSAYRSQRILLLAAIISCPDLIPAETPGNRMLDEYFEQQTRRLDQACLADVKTLDDWKAARDGYREQLFDMLGLSPRPEKTPLNPIVTGIVEEDDFVVERVYFQSRPGLYVTGNFYRPKQTSGKLPTILYVCGHGRVKKNGISYGNKVHYQHHGAWFARNGYNCLTIDTLQLGEIEGIHHGTYNHGMWWWNARGYTPAGVEAWNCIRALDYLETRPEVDATRFGVTGRSGGGAYSWWIAALDERIQAAVPVAGITTLQNHVVDGCVEGHCDCMYMVNTYRWDYAQVAALVAPRPLLISNSDKDRIFPLDGVVDLYFDVRRIYELHDAGDQLGLQVTEGPHKDTQELRIHAFHWFNRFLKKEDSLIDSVAVKFFEPEQLRVFDALPVDERNTRVHESFTVQASPADPSRSFRPDRRKQVLEQLRTLCFRGWPDPVSEDSVPPSRIRQSSHRDGLRLDCVDYTSQDSVRLTLHLIRPDDDPPTGIDVLLLDQNRWNMIAGELKTVFPGVKDFEQVSDDTPQASSEQFRRKLEQIRDNRRALVVMCPRGTGLNHWVADDRKQVQIRRRFMLLGQTVDSMRLWDVLQALRIVANNPDLNPHQPRIQAQGTDAVLALYAAFLEPDLVADLELSSLPGTHADGPTFLNVLRVTDIPEVLGHVLTTTRIRCTETHPSVYSIPRMAVDQGHLPPGHLVTTP